MQLNQTPLGKPCSTNGADRNNNFNFLRFFLATLVLLSHSAELIDGNRKREILTQLFGTISFGEMAVDGFFILSGFLILQSWERDPNLFHFIKNRFLRIFPAFIVASLISAFVVGPLGSDTTKYFTQFNLIQYIKSLIFLSTPIVPPTFEGLPYASINGSMWTIAYEFRCYMIVALLGICGFAWRRNFWLVLTLLALLPLLIPNILNQITFRGVSSILFGSSQQFFHLLAFFMAGGCFYLFRNEISFKTSWMFVAAIVLILCFFNIRTTPLAFIILGAYILFWFAFSKFQLLEQFKRYPDISYGFYLYGWPIQKLLIWYIPSLSPWLLFIFAFGFSCFFGLLSWNVVERPFLRRKETQNTVVRTPNFAKV